ncbi:MAG: DNA-3-methyladenine glycosylase I [Desulfuromonadales bacterium]
MIRRCGWCGSDPLYVAYHDKEWGVPEYDDRKLFEMLVLEGAQAGLSWLTILKKRDNYRRTFHRFDPQIIARYGARDIDRLLHDPGIVRNRLKIEAAINNARKYLQILEELDSLSNYLWAFVDHTPIVNQRATPAEIPGQTAISEKMSKDLKQRGFNFVGPTICYAFMQAVGMVNDHTIDCFRHRQLQ